MNYSNFFLISSKEKVVYCLITLAIIGTVSYPSSALQVLYFDLVMESTTMTGNHRKPGGRRSQEPVAWWIQGGNWRAVDSDVHKAITASRLGQTFSCDTSAHQNGTFSAFSQRDDLNC